ncbi:DHA1 family chloramphenicol resistance protein-like MFS transporter [Actinocorallia herbida]|uniref:DHA1 family chloramphenicol resistance protein-like MFS transporter n=1 Tax=Actinocorallia herbida TaxID=58109 RepID=A0A3N1D513_9ACTN|nr:Cmx/CmrA family chloramphenicol efflux MFS transporter [Actinocorallia herbida]ROO88546.1 DHA1 family chloramphenicol resistance protein-like MFS transporter [Actinocorallia herbida]
MPLSLYLLAVAVFAMGTSEFMLAGLLPDIADDLGVPVGEAGLLTAAFAVGMAVGAPLMAALARRWPRRTALLAFLGLFFAAHVVGAVADGLPVLLGTRVIAALANAGFLAVALTTAAALVPADRKGRALSVLLGGTTAATIAGVPGGALLGALLGWRAAFWAVALGCAPAALGVLRGVPGGRGGSRSSADPRLRAELAELRRPRLAVVMAGTALVTAGTFGAFTFLAPVVTEVAGLGPFWVPVALVLFGVGSLAGVTFAGRLSDARPGTVLAVCGPLLPVGWAAFALAAPHPVALLTMTLVQGALGFAVGSTLIARVLYEASGAPTMAGSYATAALNVGAAAGPVLAAATLDASATGPAWTAVALAVAALLCAPVFRALAVRGILVEGAGR